MIDDLETLINDKGKAFTLRRVTAGAYAPSTSSGTVSNVDYIVRGLIINYKDRNRDGTQVKAGDRKAIIKAKGLTVAPRKGDFFVVDSKALEIIEVQQVEESGVIVSYHCQIRG